MANSVIPTQLSPFGKLSSCLVAASVLFLTVLSDPAALAPFPSTEQFLPTDAKEVHADVTLLLLEFLRVF